MIVVIKCITSQKSMWDVLLGNSTLWKESLQSYHIKHNKFNHHMYREPFEGQGTPNGSETLFYGKDVALDLSEILFLEVEII